MSDLLDLDIAAATPLQTFEDATGACVDNDGAGVQSWDLIRIAAAPGPRTAASLSSDELLSVGYSLLAAFTAPSSPKLLQVSLAARAAGGDAADVKARIKRAICQDVVEYLWRCDDHGELRVDQGFLILPTAHPETRVARPPPTNTSGVGPSTSRGTAANEEPSTGRSSERPIDALDDSTSEVADNQSVADRQEQRNATTRARSDHYHAS